MPVEKNQRKLREAAEKALQADNISNTADHEKLVHELNVHQIELEMQNNELLASQHKLQQSRQRFETLFEYAPIAYFVFNAEGGIQEVNQAGAALLRTERAYLDRKPFVVFLAKEYHSVFFDHLRRVFETGHRQTAELQISSRAGNQIWVRLESRRQPDHEGREQCLTAVADMTDQKRMEDDLILAREDAVAANSAKNSFLASISHELRTPMNGIISMTELVLDTELTEEQQGYMAVIHSSARSLLSVVGDLLDVSMIEAAHVALKKEPFRLRDLVSTVQAMFLPAAARKGITLSTEIDETVNDLFRGDRNRIRQVLVNLTGNAIKFTESGSVTIRIREQDLSDFLWEITFEVADTGPGITPAEQKRISDMFRQIQDDDASRYEGTQLGLAISRKLARLMGGQLFFRSAPDAGTRFFFSIPLEHAREEDFGVNAESTEESGHTATNAARGKILVAEDNSINVLVIRTILEKNGYAVTVVHDGREAIRALETESFHVVLMDISMPGMDGITATREIRRRGNCQGFNSEIPIIAISAHSMKGDRERFLKAGMTDYISKPFVQETVLSVIQRAMMGHDGPVNDHAQ